MYLYFNETLKKIVACVVPTDKEGLTPLTEEQVAYWKKHRTAHWSQILKAEEPKPYAPTLEELKTQAVQQLSSLSLDILGSHVSEYQLVNARLSLDAAEGDKIYDDDKSQDVIDVYLEVGKQCRTLYYEAKAAIEECEDADTLEELRNGYTERYEKLRNKNAGAHTGGGWQ